MKRVRQLGALCGFAIPGCLRSTPPVKLGGRRRWLKIPAMVGCALSCWAGEALACGGLFCAASNPVNQAAERIVFSDNGDGTITAVIEIQYEGPAERFSWVLPVAGTPEVGLSSVAALDRLQQTTNPRYVLQNVLDDTCSFRSGGFADAGAVFNDGGVGSELEESSAEPPVLVLASGSLGPFDWSVIEVTDSAAAPAQAALDWLTENGYDVTSLGEELLGEYLASGLNLIAFRLSKDADTGSIRPVSLTYEADSSVIPIRPTAVAANEDMGVLVWVLGPDRAVPTNFLTLELNEMLIDWFNPNATYRDVVTAAANEAGGNGFVTEMASRDLSLTVFIEQSEWQHVQTLTAPEERLDLLLDSARDLGSLDGFADVVRDTVPLREGVTVEEYLECPSCYFPTQTDETVWGLPTDGGVDAGTYTTTHTYPVFPADGTDPITTIDVEVYLAALQELVIAPMEATQALLDDAQYVTRLFTTLSPDEMKTDPVFLFNPDLEEVDNLHIRERLVSCDDFGDQTWQMDFEGTLLEGTNSDWPLAIGQLPANRRILQLSTSGPGEVVEDMSEQIDEMMPVAPVPSDSPSDPSDDSPPEPSDESPGPGSSSEADAGDPAPSAADDDATLADGGSMPSSEATVSESDCGCRTVGGTSSTPALPAALLGVGLLLLGRRRRY